MNAKWKLAPVAIAIALSALAPASAAQKRNARSPAPHQLVATVGSRAIGALDRVAARVTSSRADHGRSRRGRSSYGAGYGRSYGIDRCGTQIPSRVWVPGCYENRGRQVWVSGTVDRIWIEPVFEFRYDSCGNRIRVETCAGYWKEIARPGCYETRYEQVWIPGHWTYR